MGIVTSMVVFLLISPNLIYLSTYFPCRKNPELTVKELTESPDDQVKHDCLYIPLEENASAGGNQ